MAHDFRPGGRFHYLISEQSDLPPTPIRQRYFVFSQQRTGSTLLTETLLETGQAGVPIEYFNPDVGIAFWKRIGNGAEWTLKPYYSYIERHRVTPNGVFGFKAHLSQLDWFMKKPERQQRFVRRFDRVILSYRRDKLAQAVSFHRAMAGGLWFVGRDRERRAPNPAELEFDAAKLLKSAASFMLQEERQRRLIARAGVPLLALPYERLDEDFAGAMRDVFAFLELPVALADGLAPSLQKLRDEASQEMIDRALATLRDSDTGRAQAR
jgi:LPS sulfotransferase NodH